MKMLLKTLNNIGKLYSISNCARFSTKIINVQNEVNFIRKRKMKAWHLHSYGNLDEIKLSEKYRTPFIRNSEEVLVKIHAASVNPIDVAMISGYGSTLLNVMRCNDLEFPLSLGRDFCGTVVDVGQNVNRSICLGDTVWGVVPVHLQGCHAEYVLVGADCITKKPKLLTDLEAASIPYAGLTAWNALFSTCLNLTSGYGLRNKRILVLGAAGGVGSIAVQILVAECAQVTAVCSSDATEYVANLGVTDILDYTSPDYCQNIINKGPFDVIFDCAGLGPSGAEKYPWKYLSYITLSSPMLKNTDESGLITGMIKNVFNLMEPNIKSFSSGQGTIKWSFFRPSLEGLSYLAKLVDDGKLKPSVSKVYTFDKIPEAYTKILNGHMRGKVVVNMT